MRPYRPQRTRHRPEVAIRSRRCGGYTLGEITNVVAIVGVLAAFTVPPFMNLYMSTRVKTAASEFASSLRLARQTAAERRAPVQVVAAGRGGWSDGWQVRARNQVLLDQSGPLRIDVSASGDRQVVYGSTGTSARAGGRSFRFHAPGYRWVTPRCVVIRPDGRPLVLLERAAGPPCR